eukprot:205901_1
MITTSPPRSYNLPNIPPINVATPPKTAEIINEEKSLETTTAGLDTPAAIKDAMHNAIPPTPNDTTLQLNMKQVNVDPYHSINYYLSNSALTPKSLNGIPPTPPCPSPMQFAASAASFAAAAGTSTISTTNHDQRKSVLLKLIMNRNHSQQMEIERLTEQINVLNELEMKNKQEVHRWYTDWSSSQQNEKNMKIKHEKLGNDYKSLQLKNDGLQIKYLKLDEKYKSLLNSKDGLIKKEYE